MMKKFSFLFFFGLFFMFNPFIKTYALTNDEVIADYNNKKANMTAYVEYRLIIPSTGESAIYLYDLSAFTDKDKYKFIIEFDGTGGYLINIANGVLDGAQIYYYNEHKSNTYLGTGGHSFSTPLYVKRTYQNSNGLTLNIEPLTTKGLNFVNNDWLDVFPPPPTIEDDGQFGYEFIYPKNDEIINLLNNNNSSYLKVPFKVKIKNYYPWGTKTVEEKIKNNFSINNYKTEITSFIWEKKTDILGLSDYGLFNIDGFYYIPIGTTSDSLQANIYMPSEPWLDGSVQVTYTYDGSKPNYNPIDTGGSDTGGSIGDNGNVNIGGTDYGDIPSAPVDGDIGDWFQYIGSLLLWLVTYPFKLLGQMVSTLTGYITSMFGILTPVTAQLNSVLSFVPSDILNVCWGFLSFTILYSVLKSVFKMIRG